jgi:membrane-bound serine protease (ClpP class)
VSAPRVFRRYLLFQLPGWVIVGTLCALAVRWPGISPATAVVLFAAWVAKDLLLYPWLRHGYVPGPADSHRSLVGATGVAEQALAPSGWVRVRGELWRARVRSGIAVLDKGAAVRVVEVDGMEIVVEPL